MVIFGNKVPWDLINVAGKRDLGNDMFTTKFYVWFLNFMSLIATWYDSSKIRTD